MNDINDERLAGRRRRRRNRILLIHPDEALRGFVLRGLPKAEFDAEVATNSEQGLIRVYQSIPDIVIMAEELPPVNGEELLSQIRQICDIPIIVLGTREGELAGARMLELGADVYMPKPLSLGELVARVYSLIRRLARSQAKITSTHRTGLGTKSDPWGSISIEGEHVDLTPTESRLLSYLRLSGGKVVPSSHLMTEVWGDKPVSSDVLKVYIRRLRQKLGDDSTSPVYILNERGIGYRWGKAPDEHLPNTYATEGTGSPQQCGS